MIAIILFFLVLFALYFFMEPLQIWKEQMKEICRERLWKWVDSQETKGSKLTTSSESTVQRIAQFIDPILIPDDSSESSSDEEKVLE